MNCDECCSGGCCNNVVTLLYRCFIYRLLGQFAFKLDRDHEIGKRTRKWEKDFILNVQEMLTKYHLFSWEMGSWSHYHIILFFRCPLLNCHFITFLIKFRHTINYCTRTIQCLKCCNPSSPFSLVCWTITLQLSFHSLVIHQSVPHTSYYGSGWSEQNLSTLFYSFFYLYVLCSDINEDDKQLL